MVELLLKFVGDAQIFLARHPVLTVAALGLLFSVSSVIGETLLYWAARLGGRPLVFRCTRLLRVGTREVDRVEALFSRWGIGLVIFGRILPGVRTLVSIPAGISRMNFGLYLSTSFTAGYVYNTLWFTGLYLLGYQLTVFGIPVL